MARESWDEREPRTRRRSCRGGLVLLAVLLGVPVALVALLIALDSRPEGFVLLGRLSRLGADPYPGVGAQVVPPPGWGDAHPRYDELVAFDGERLVARGRGRLLTGSPPRENAGVAWLQADGDERATRAVPNAFAIDGGWRAEFFEFSWNEVFDLPRREPELHLHRDRPPQREWTWTEPTWQGYARLAIVGEHLVALHGATQGVKLDTLALATLADAGDVAASWRGLLLHPGHAPSQGLAHAAGRLFAYVGGTLFVIRGPPAEPEVLASWNDGESKPGSYSNALAVTPDGTRVAVGERIDGDRRWVAVLRIAPDGTLALDARIESSRGAEEAVFGGDLAFVGDVLAISSAPWRAPDESRLLFFDASGAPTRFGGLDVFRVPGYASGFDVVADPDGSRLAIGSQLDRDGPPDREYAPGVLFLLHR